MPMPVPLSFHFFPDLRFCHHIHSSESMHQVHQVHQHTHIQCTQPLQCQVQVSLQSFHKHFHDYTLSQATANSVSVCQIHIFVCTTTQHTTFKQKKEVFTQKTFKQSEKNSRRPNCFHFTLPSFHYCHQKTASPRAGLRPELDSPHLSLLRL